MTIVGARPVAEPDQVLVDIVPALAATPYVVKRTTKYPTTESAFMNTEMLAAHQLGILPALLRFGIHHLHPAPAHSCLRPCVTAQAPARA